MTIDTGKRTERIVLMKQIFAIAVLILSILAFYRPIRLWLRAGGVEPWLLTAILVALYIVYRLYFRVRSTTYLYISDTALPGIIRIRHFEIKPLNNKQFALEIPHRELYRFELVKKRLGLLEQLTLWQRRGSKIFKYPPFSITLLRRKERQQLVAMLQKYSEKKLSQGVEIF